MNCSISSLEIPQIRQFCLGADDSQTSGRRFPLRLLRYWFMYHLLKKELTNKKRADISSLSVCEIGVDRGQMLHYVTNTEASESGDPHLSWIRRWDAVDVHLQSDILTDLGYSQLVQYDLEQDEGFDQIHAQYDVVILLHVLEHLHDPEAALERILSCLKPGGIVIGGMPVLPQLLAPWREKHLRLKAKPFGHVSAFSPRRIKNWTGRMGLQNEFCSGAFFMRAKKLPFEKWSRWIQFNLWFGAHNPSWPGEIYWSFRKPADDNPAKVL